MLLHSRQPTWGFVLAAVGQDGKAILHASAELQADRDLVLAADKQKGDALSYAVPQLKADRDMDMAIDRACENEQIAAGNKPSR